MKLRGTGLTLLAVTASGCDSLPPMTIDMPLEAHQDCGFPEFVPGAVVRASRAMVSTISRR